MTSDPEIVVIVVVVGCIYGAAIGVCCRLITDSAFPPEVHALLCAILLVWGMLMTGRDSLINGIMELVASGR